MYIYDAKVEAGNFTLSNNIKMQIDSFFPGIVLPKDMWSSFRNFIESKKKEGRGWKNLTCYSDPFVSTCKFIGDRCQDLDLGSHYNFSITLNNQTKMHVPVKSFTKSERLLVNRTEEQNNCIIMIYYREDQKDAGVILGNSFFENYYVMWDFDIMKIGFNGYFETVKPDPQPLNP